MVQPYYQITALYNETGKLDKIFTEEDVALMFFTLAKCKDYLKTIWGDFMKARDMCVLAAIRYMLLRPKEACKIKFEDLDFKEMVLHVNRENNKQKKDRYISIPEKFLIHYKRLMLFPKYMWKGSHYVFISAAEEFLSPSRWKTTFREKILKPAGLYESPGQGRIPRARSYLLRASGATQLLDKGVDPWTVAQTLGHADLRTVKNYFFQTKNFRRRQVESLNQLY